MGEVGEIQVRPHHPGTILREYWGRPDATIAATRNLWFHTGDRARQDEDGFFYYVDRVKDSIRRRGENVSSWEVENVVNGFAGVVESAAYGVPSDLGEDDVMVAVVLEAGAIAGSRRARGALLGAARLLRRPALRPRLRRTAEDPEPACAEVPSARRRHHLRHHRPRRARRKAGLT